ADARSGLSVAAVESGASVMRDRLSSRSASSAGQLGCQLGAPGNSGTPGSVVATRSAFWHSCQYVDRAGSAERGGTQVGRGRHLRSSLVPRGAGEAHRHAHRVLPNRRGAGRPRALDAAEEVSRPAGEDEDGMTFAGASVEGRTWCGAWAFRLRWFL